MQTGFTVLGDALVRRLETADAVVGSRKDGLFARINCLLNTIRLAEVLGKPAIYLWEEFRTRAPVPHGYDDDWRAILIDDRIVSVPPTQRGAIPESTNLRAWLPALLPNETLDEVMAHLRGIALGLQLADGRTVAESFTPNAYAFGLHARQGDAAQLRYTITKYFPASGWFQVLDKVLTGDPDAVAFIASDGQSLLDEAVRQHGARVRVPSDVLPPGRGKMAADFAEALQLAQARRLIAPRQSAFSTFAGLVSGVPVEPPETVLGIEAIVEDLVAVALKSYERDLGAALVYLDELGVDVTPLARQRSALLAAENRLRGRPSGAGPKDASAAPRHPATVGVGAQGVMGYATPSQADILAVLGLLSPREPTLGKVRIGADHDGGYVIANDLEGIAGAISIGVGGDVSFDLDLAGRGIPVLLVDHTVDKLPNNHPLFTHDRRAWAAETDDGTVSLADLVGHMDTLAGRPGTDLLLKVDVEGSEWVALPVAQAGLLRRFRIITIELHGLMGLGRPGRLRTVERRLSALLENHEVMHLHANNGGRVAWVKGVPLASTVEVSLLRRDRATFSTEPVRIPGPLDRPNVPGRPDLVWTPINLSDQQARLLPKQSNVDQGALRRWFSRRQ